MVFSRKQSTTDANSRPASKTTVFKKLQDFGEYAESKDRLDELSEQRRELQSKVAELESLLGDDADDGQSTIRAQAAELVSGGVATAIAKPNIRVELNAKKEQLAIVGEAISMQQKALAESKRSCITEMMKERRPAHAVIVQKMNDALTALEQAICDERAFRSQTVDAGLRVPEQIPMIPLPGNLGHQRGTTWEAIHQWRVKMTRVGYLKYDGRN